MERLRVETLDGAEIVDDISFDVHGGEVLALVGESGSGKTTTALALLGHARVGTRITSSSIRFDGQELLALHDRTLRRLRGSRISYVPQDPTSGLNPRHRVGHQIAEALRVHGRTRSVASDVVRDLARRVGLPAERAFLRRYPFELSGGQQQRVAIAMALACKPLVVVLDEPTTGLDVTTQARVLDLLRDLSRESGAAFVYITHDLAVVGDLADRVAVMYAGRIVESGPLDVVFRRPSHPYTSLLLGSVPRLSVRSRLAGIEGTAPPPGARPHGCFFEPRCPLAIEQCRTEFPGVTRLERGHEVRCWRASDVIPTSERPLGLPSPARDATLLAVDHLVASYGRGASRRIVLDDVSFSIVRGECLALVGESGSGKTTLGRCIAGLHRPDSGTVSFDGSILAPHVTGRSRDERRAVQIVFQSPERSLNPSETVAAAIIRPLRLFGYADRRTERSQARELLHRVRLPGRMLDRYPRELSGGEKQRVAIARALAARPSLLVCDEVTSSLDVSIQAEIVTLLEGLRRDGLVLLFITHNLALVNSIADRVLVLEAGKIRELGETAQVIRHPAHPYTRQLVAAAPDLRVSQPR